MFQETLTPEKLNAYLSAAAERQSPVTVALASGSDWVIGRSRMLGWDDQAGGVVLAQPHAPQGREPLALALHQPLAVKFVAGDRHVSFLSAIRELREPCRFQSVPTVEVPLPAEVTCTNHRSSFRVKIGPDAPLPVVLTGLRSANGAPPVLHRARAMDISSTGLAVTDLAPPPNWPAGTALAARLEPLDDEPLLLQAHVRRAWTLPEGHAALGVEFRLGDMPEPVNPRAQRLNHIVTRYQRLWLQRKVGTAG